MKPLPYPEYIAGGGKVKGVKVGKIPKESDNVILELDCHSAQRGSYSYGTGIPSQIEVIVIGCGGNGGHVVPQVMRFIRAVSDRINAPTVGGRARSGEVKFDITLIDGDLVEQKNLVRQNFIAPDIGKNKAMVMAERYGRAFGIEVGAIDQYLTEEMADDILWKGTGRCQIVLGCVDNNYTRKVLHNVLVEKPMTDYANIGHLFWIDVANELFDGQICIGHRSPHAKHSNDRYRGDTHISSPGFWEIVSNKVKDNMSGLPVLTRGAYFPMPFITEIYPSMLEGKPDFDPNDPSCADNAARADQAMATNVLSASLMFSAFVQCVGSIVDPGPSGQEIEGVSGRRPRAYLIHFGHGGRFQVHHNTLSNLKPIFLNGEEPDE